jgi:hypothetical protein
MDRSPVPPARPDFSLPLQSTEPSGFGANIMSFEQIVIHYGAELAFLAAVLLAFSLLRLTLWSGVQAATADKASGASVSPWQRSKRPIRRRKSARLKVLPNPQGRVEAPASTANTSICRWRIDGLRHRNAEFTRWICLDCDAEGYSRDTAPPVTCKRGLKPRAI